MRQTEGVEALKAAGVETAPRDAQLLWDAAKGDEDLFAEWITRRGETREPVSRILGRRAFWDHDFLVTPDVLDPRPDTETLVEHALATRWDSVLDLGTGSGCIILSLLAARTSARGMATDISQAALDTALQNARQLGLLDRVKLHKSDWFQNVAGRFDLIVSNPPYITARAFEELAPEVRQHDPKRALTPGGDGLAPYRIIAAQATDYLTPQGTVMVEIGYDQAQAVELLFKQAGFDDVSVQTDINGKDRVVTARICQNGPEA